MYKGKNTNYVLHDNAYLASILMQYIRKLQQNSDEIYANIGLYIFSVAI